MNNFLAMSAAGGIVVALMLLLRPLTAKLFSAKWHYRMGKIAILFFLAPVTFITVKLIPVPPTTWVHSPLNSLTVPSFIPQSPAAVLDESEITMLFTSEKWTFELILNIGVFIWLAGVVVLSVWYLYCYRRFWKELYTGGTPLTEDNEIHGVLRKCQEKLGVHGRIRLLQNDRVTSPRLVGIIRPAILLHGSDSLREADLELVLSHELMHVKQKDLWVKMAALIVGILHWYNPFAYMLRKDIHTWGELSCDEAMALNMTWAERKRYGETILNTLDNHSSYEAAFSSSLSGNVNQIKRRLTMLLNVKKMKKPAVVLSAAAILAIGGTGVVVSNLVANAAPVDYDTAQVNKIAVGPLASEGDLVRLSETDTILGPDTELKKIEVKGDGKAYTFEEFKQWLEKAKLEADQLVQSGEWTEEQAAKRLAPYERTVIEIEANGGHAFGKLAEKEDGSFPEQAENFYTPDELVFELPAGLEDSIKGEVGFTLAIGPKY